MKKSSSKSLVALIENSLKTNASVWVAQQQLQYAETLLNSLAKSEPPRGSHEAKFFHALHGFYSMRALQNSDIQTERSRIALSLQRCEIWQEFVLEPESLQVKVSLNRNKSGKLKEEILNSLRVVTSLSVRLIRKITPKKIAESFVKQLNLGELISQLSRFTPEKHDYTVEVGAYRFTKIEIVALVEVMLHLGEETLASNVLTHTSELFSREPDNLWFEHIQLRCEHSMTSLESHMIYNSQIYNICKLEKILVDASEMTFDLNAYIVEKDELITFENKVCRFESEVPREEDCVSINKLSFISKNDSILLNQGEFYSPRDFFIGPTGRNLIGLSETGMLAWKTERKDKYEGRYVPFLLSSGSSSNYWHALVEALPRLVNLDEDQPIIWIGGLPKYVREVVGALKPKARFFAFPSTGVTLDKVKVSPLSIMSHEPFWETEIPHFDPSTLKKFRDELLSKFQGSKEWNSGIQAEKVFLLRKSTHRTSELDSFIRSLEDSGFVVVDPSKLGLINQAKLFSSAKILVGEVGAVWANLIFCNPETKVFSLCSETSAPTPLFGGFAQILSLDFHSLAFPNSWNFDPRTHWNNTQEAFYQSGFTMNQDFKNRALNYILNNSMVTLS